MMVLNPCKNGDTELTSSPAFQHSTSSSTQTQPLSTRIPEKGNSLKDFPPCSLPTGIISKSTQSSPHANSFWLNPGHFFFFFFAWALPPKKLLLLLFRSGNAWSSWMGEIFSSRFLNPCFLRCSVCFQGEISGFGPVVGHLIQPHGFAVLVQ